MAASAEEIAEGWGRAVVHGKKFLMHLPTLACGHAETFYDGKTDVYASPSGQLVSGPVLKLDSGHALVASNPNAFVVLTAGDVEVYEKLLRRMADAVGEAASGFASARTERETGLKLVSSALRTVMSVANQMTAQPGGKP